MRQRLKQFLYRLQYHYYCMRLTRSNDLSERSYLRHMQSYTKGLIEAE